MTAATAQSRHVFPQMQFLVYVHSTKLEFQLHEGHAFRHDGESDEIVA